jgi:hypothetical protein
MIGVFCCRCWLGVSRRRRSLDTECTGQILEVFRGLSSKGKKDLGRFGDRYQPVGKLQSNIYGSTFLRFAEIACTDQYPTTATVQTLYLTSSPSTHLHQRYDAKFYLSATVLRVTRTKGFRQHPHRTSLQMLQTPCAL